MSSATLQTRLLDPDGVALMRSMLALFAEAFDEEETYAAAPPSAGYLRRLLGNDSFIALVALMEGQVVGGIAAYELMKCEQERSEIYLYDLAVASAHRRVGVATALINELRQVAAARGAHVVYVQADVGDHPAISLYSKLGTRAEVLHFDMPVPR